MEMYTQKFLKEFKRVLKRFEKGLGNVKDRF